MKHSITGYPKEYSITRQNKEKIMITGVEIDFVVEDSLKALSF